MTEFDHILDEQGNPQLKQDPRHYLAKGGIRFIHYILDYFGATICMVLMMVPFMILADATHDSDFEAFGVLAFYLGYPAYYIGFEHFFGRTPAKMLTGTRVVRFDGEKPTFWQIVGRNFARLIPFEQFSFFGGGAGLHDTISKTYVVTKEFNYQEKQEEYFQ